MWPFRRARQDKPAGRQRQRYGPEGPHRGYDNALDRRGTREHWRRATSGDADKEADAARPTLRDRARYEIRNNCFARGMVDAHANDCVGTGPTLAVNTGYRPQLNNAFEKGFNAWAESASADGRASFWDLLRLCDSEQFRSGELFVQLVTLPDASGPVKLRLLPVEGDRVQTPTDKLIDENIRDGVERDPATGAPVAYWVLKRHPGAKFSFRSASSDSRSGFTRVPAESMIHVFRPDRPGQTRGVPWLQPALDLFGQLRDFTRATNIAAETAANLTSFTYAECELDYEDLKEQELPVDDIEPGTNTTLPAGRNIKFGSPAQPATTFPMYRREILSEIGRAVGMPYNILVADSSQHNYAGAKLDQQGYVRGLDDWRKSLERLVCDRVFAEVARELVFAGAVRAPGALEINSATSSWVWPPIKHADPSKEANALKILRALRAVSFVEMCQELGKDWRRVVDEEAAAAAYAALKGVDLPDKVSGTQGFKGGVPEGQGADDASDGYGDPEEGETKKEKSA